MGEGDRMLSAGYVPVDTTDPIIGIYITFVVYIRYVGITGHAKHDTNLGPAPSQGKLAHVPTYARARTFKCLTHMTVLLTVVLSKHTRSIGACRLHASKTSLICNFA